MLARVSFSMKHNDGRLRPSMRKTRSPVAGGKTMHTHHQRICKNTRSAPTLAAIMVAAICHAAAAPFDAPRRSPGEDIFTEGQIPRIRIEISRGALEQLRQRPRAYITATI